MHIHLQQGNFNKIEVKSKIKKNHCLISGVILNTALKTMCAVQYFEEIYPLDWGKSFTNRWIDKQIDKQDDFYVH